jgi:hypothetical protein
MAVNYSINKPKEPDNQPSEGNLLKKEKKDFEILKIKESKRDIFGPLTNKETERLQNLSIKREKEDEDLTGGM